MKALFKIGTIVLLAFSYTTSMGQQKKVLRKELLNAVINQKITMVDIKEISMESGQVAPKHLHPCPVVGYVKSGTVIFQVEGEEKVVLNEGDAFYEPKNKKILHFDNASKEKPLRFVAFYLKETDEENIKLIN
ncbi:cupin domain-containing protein [Solitalea lacus]|uniref:cupin domain-containing protein n=1 Tax=Solitalea lacus TaxID=2911172 RepID=UPI001EDA0F40|nr:cupin domain-containing protein [Solitalea lacus]UKJ08766.1 cupin domain-containing protein [Solitalea lacus]